MTQNNPETGVTQNEIESTAELSSVIEEQSIALAGLANEVSEASTREQPTEEELKLVIARLRAEGVNVTLQQAKKNDSWRRKISHLASINMDIADRHDMSPVQGPVVVEDIGNPKDKRRYEKNQKKIQEYRDKLYTRDDLLHDIARKELARQRTDNAAPQLTEEARRADNDPAGSPEPVPYVPYAPKPVHAPENNRGDEAQPFDTEVLRARILRSLHDALQENDGEPVEKIGQRARLAVALEALRDRDPSKDGEFIRAFVDEFMRYEYEEITPSNKLALFERIKTEIEEFMPESLEYGEEYLVKRLIMTQYFRKLPVAEQNELMSEFLNYELGVPVEPPVTAPEQSSLSKRLAEARRQAASEQAVPQQEADKIPTAKDLHAEINARVASAKAEDGALPFTELYNQITEQVLSEQLAKLPESEHEAFRELLNAELEGRSPIRVTTETRAERVSRKRKAHEQEARQGQANSPQASRPSPLDMPRKKSH